MVDDVDVSAEEVVQELATQNPMLLELLAQRVVIRKLQAERAGEDVTTEGSDENDGG